MQKLILPKPISCGIFLTYRCPAKCKHCLYASSPKWEPDFISLEKADIILNKLSKYLVNSDYITFNAGIHFSGGEPTLNLNLLVELIKLAKKYKISPVLIETNSYWAKDEYRTVSTLEKLFNCNLDGVLISVNPFVVEYVNFKNIKLAIKKSIEIFGEHRIIVYQSIFYKLFEDICLERKLKFEDFFKNYIGYLSHMELLPMGRTVYKLNKIFKKYKAETFFYENCLEEFKNPYHIHIDNYGNYIPSFCAGISLNNVFENENMLEIKLNDYPIISALVTNIKELYYIAKQFDYKEIEYGYISKCHLCLDIRKHISFKTKEFKELNPKEFYSRLED